MSVCNFISSEIHTISYFKIDVIAKTESSMMKKKSKITLKNLGFQSKITIRAFFSQISLYYRQIIIAVFLSVTQQFCGHPNVSDFLVTI